MVLLHDFIRVLIESSTGCFHVLLNSQASWGISRKTILVLFYLIPVSIADPESAIQVASHFFMNIPFVVSISSTFS